MTTLSTALQTATTGSRELDAMIAMEWLPGVWKSARLLASMPCGASEETINRDAAHFLRPYSTDLTACVALVQEQLPDRTIGLTIYGTNGGEFSSASASASVARLFNPYGEMIGKLYRAPTPCLALLRALDDVLREAAS